MTTTSTTTTGTRLPCPRWCTVDHLAEAATPADPEVWHRRVLGQVDPGRIGFSGRSSVELAVNDDDLDEGVARRFWIWVGGNDALVTDDLDPADLLALSGMLADAAAALESVQR